MGSCGQYGHPLALEINHTFIRNVMLEYTPNEATKVIMKIVEKKSRIHEIVISKPRQQFREFLILKFQFLA